MKGAHLNNLFWLFLTYLSAPSLYFLIFLRSRKKVGDSSKILVIQAAKIGDLVCSTPVFREIKKEFPRSHLAVLITSKTKDIVENSPRIDEIILLDKYPGISGKFGLLRVLRNKKYDWVINLLPGSFTNIIGFWSLIPHRVATKSREAGKTTRILSVFNNHLLEYKIHTPLIGHFLKLLSFLGIEAVSENKEVFITAGAEKKVLDFWAANNLSGNDLIVGLSPIPGNKIKQWDLPKWAELADLLIEALGAKIIFIGSAADREQTAEIQKIMRGRAINTQGLFALHESPALINALKLFISVDSGPGYIANALNIPLVNIGGSYDIREQAPTGERVKIIQKSPITCSHMEPLSSACKETHQKILREITPNDVFEAAKSLLNRT